MSFFSNRKYLLYLLIAIVIIMVSCCIRHYKVSANIRSIMFEHPLISVRDSTSYQIFNAGSKYRYKLDFIDVDMLSGIVSQDSVEVIYNVNPKYSHARYNILYSWYGHWPDFQNADSIESYTALYQVSLIKINFVDIMRHTFGRPIDRYLSIFIKPTYINYLPDTLNLRCFKKTEKDLYFISLKNKPMVMMIPDSYWYDDDNIKYYPILVDMGEREMFRENTDIVLGNYEVWKDSTFNICKYHYHLNKFDNNGLYDMTLVPD